MDRAGHVRQNPRRIERVTVLQTTRRGAGLWPFSVDYAKISRCPAPSGFVWLVGRSVDVPRGPCEPHPCMPWYAINGPCPAGRCICCAGTQVLGLFGGGAIIRRGRRPYGQGLSPAHVTAGRHPGAGAWALLSHDEQGQVLPTSMKARELRVSTRFAIRFRSVDELVVAYSANLSRGGLFLRTRRLLTKGSQLDLAIHLPDGEGDVQVPCVVVYVRDGSDGKAEGMGLRFIDPDERVRKRLEWFIVNSAPDASELEAQAATRRLDVVVVDDDPKMAQRAASGFVARGDAVRSAGDGLGGLALCLKQTPDVVLTDVQMPRMDGWQMVRQLRSRPALARVPVLFLTSLSSEHDRLVGYRLGVDDYLTKPVEPEDVVSRVDRAVLRAAQIQASESDAERNALRGDLSQVSLQSVLAFLEVERRSGVLRIGPEVNGRLDLRDGQIVRAIMEEGGIEGPLEAVFALLDVTAGRFEFVNQEVEGQAEISLPVSNLLLEHARRRDEAK